MATTGKVGGKRQVYSSVSTGKLGVTELNSPSGWDPGKYKPLPSKGSNLSQLIYTLFFSASICGSELTEMSVLYTSAATLVFDGSAQIGNLTQCSISY